MVGAGQRLTTGGMRQCCSGRDNVKTGWTANCHLPNVVFAWSAAGLVPGVLGPVAEAFLIGAAATGGSELGGELADVLAPRAAHGDQALVAALEVRHALRVLDHAVTDYIDHARIAV
jgi:hypothetical protein